MVSHSLKGRILFGSYFIFSGWKMFIGSFVDPIYKEEFASKFAGLIALFGATDSAKNNIPGFFVSSFAGEQVFGGFCILFGHLTGGIIYLGTYLLTATPILFDFYRYKVGEPQFFLLLQGFLQNMAFFGVLLIFVEMNTTFGRELYEWTLDLTQLQKNIPKKSTTQHQWTLNPTQLQKNIPEKSMTQHQWTLDPTLLQNNISEKSTTPHQWKLHPTQLQNNIRKKSTTQHLWTLGPAQLQNNIQKKSTTQYQWTLDPAQLQNNIPQKSTAQHGCATLSPRTFLLPVTNIQNLCIAENIKVGQEKMD